MLTSLSPRKKQSGFTFLEVVAVTVIVSILAAIAIPIYNNNIDSKRKDVVNQLAQTAAVSANAHWRRTGADPSAEDLNLFLPQENRFEVTVNGDNRTVTVKDISTDPAIESDPAQY